MIPSPAVLAACPGVGHQVDGGPSLGSRPEGRPPRVLMLDPNASTPPYDRALCAALARAGCNVALATSRFLYEDLPPARGFRVEETFFRLVGGRAARRLGRAEPAA